MSRYLVFNGTLQTEEEILLSPLNRGMMYGDGFFDTFRSYKGRFLLLEKHFERIFETVQFLGIDIHFGFEDFRFKILELLEANELLSQDALVRVQCWREGKRGYETDSRVANWITTATPINAFKDEITLASVNTRVIPNEALDRRFKLSNGLNYILAAKEASKSGADDGLMLTTTKKVSEAASANVFWIKGTDLFTPSENCDLLPGITRNKIIELIEASKGITIEEGEFDLSEAKQAEAFFISNSIKEIIPVSSLDTVFFDIQNPVLTQIKESFDEFKNSNLK